MASSSPEDRLDLVSDTREMERYGTVSEVRGSFDAHRAVRIEAGRCLANKGHAGIDNIVPGCQTRLGHAPGRQFPPPPAEGSRPQWSTLHSQAASSCH